MTFPIGNTRASLGFEDPQEASNVTENTSLVSTVAETALASSTTTQTSQISIDTMSSEISGATFTSDAGEAAVAASVAALSALDTVLEDVYVDMASVRQDSESQTDLLSGLEFLREMWENPDVQRVLLRKPVGERFTTYGADLFARSSTSINSQINSRPPRASMEGLDDISLLDDLEISLHEETEEKIQNTSVLRTQLFGFFINLVKQDLLHDNISGGRVKDLFDAVSGGMSRQEYTELLDLIKEGDFTSTQDIAKFCNIFMSTPKFKSSQGLQTLFAFFKGEGGAVTSVLLQELMGVLTGTFGLPLPSGLSSFLHALKNLYETTHPNGTSNMEAAVSLVSLVSGVLQSETTQRVMQSCYDGCADSCAGNCGCVGCGCADGASGCGGFGSFFCGLFASCFHLNTNRGGITEESFKKLEKKYSSAVVLIALNNLGVNNVDLLSGKRLGLPTLEEVKAECESASNGLNQIIKSKSRETWGEAACRYPSLLSRPLLKEGIIGGLSNRYMTVNDNKLRGRVFIDCSWGSEGFISTHEPFDSQRLVSSLASLSVKRAGSSAFCRLGAADASDVMTNISRILSVAISTGDSIWLSTEDLMALVCVVLAHKNLSVVDGQGSDMTRIQDSQEIKDLFSAVEENLVRVERNQQRDIRSSLNASVLYSQIARNASRRETSYRPLKDRARTEVRNNLVTKMSMPWMRVAGLVLTNTAPQGRDEVDRPAERSLRDSRSVHVAQVYRETSV